MEYEILEGNQHCGVLQLEQKGLYTHCDAVIDRDSEQLYELFLVGEEGSLRLGVPEWRDGRFSFRRTISNRELSGVGSPVGGSLRRREGEAGAASEDEWLPLPKPECFFRESLPELALYQQCIWKAVPGGRLLAVPCSEDMPFPLPQYFCFAQIGTLQGRRCVFFRFDEQDLPGFAGK